MTGTTYPGRLDALVEELAALVENRKEE